MAKSLKCAPGVICIENYTVLFLLILIGIALYALYRTQTTHHTQTHTTTMLSQMQPAWMGGLTSIPTRNDPFNDPYAPPLKMVDYMQPSQDLRGEVPIHSVVPINVKTRGFNTEFRQIGILTRKNGNDNMILPLMGSRVMTGRDKWNYYTISNNGNINTKLPISVAGRSCTNEYGCDEIYNNDSVYVEGYKDVFIATVYENGLMSYIPVV